MSKKKADKLDIAANLRKFRTARGMTTSVLAEKVGVSQPQVSRLENGQQGFRSSTADKLAKAVGVPVWALFMTETEQALAVDVMGLKVA